MAKFFTSLFLVYALTSSVCIFGQTDNTFLGTRAGTDITTGDDNVCIGVDAGGNGGISKGIFIGNRAGDKTGDKAGAVTNQGLIFIGHEAGAQCTTCFDITAIGLRAGSSLTTQGDNTFIGDDAGRECTGIDNVFVGDQAGRYCTTCKDSTFIGSHAGRGSVGGTTGQKNSGFGTNALTYIGSGSHNTAAGYYALGDVETGNGNTAAGNNAGIDVGAGIANSFFGINAGVNLERTSSNTMIGAFAGGDTNRHNDGNGKANTLVGVTAGSSMRLGNYNTLIGAFVDHTPSTETYVQSILQDPQAQYYGETGTAHTVTDVIEHMAALGSNIAVRASGATALGAATRVYSENGVAIGKGAHVDAAAATNSVAIGAGTKVTQPNVIALGGDSANGMPMTVGIAKASPNTHASLHLGATDKGLLLNRLTTAQRNSLGAKLGGSEAGMLVYDTDQQLVYVWDSNLQKWKGLDVGQSSNKKSYTLQASADLSGSGGPSVSYGGALDTGFVPSSDAEIVSIAVALDSSVTSGGLTFQVTLDGTTNAQQLNIVSGRKGFLTFSPGISVAAGKKLKILVTDNNSAGATAASIVLKLAEVVAPVGAPTEPTGPVTSTIVSVNF